MVVSYGLNFNSILLYDLRTDVESLGTVECVSWLYDLTVQPIISNISPQSWSQRMFLWEFYLSLPRWLHLEWSRTWNSSFDFQCLITNYCSQCFNHDCLHFGSVMVYRLWNWSIQTSPPSSPQHGRCWWTSHGSSWSWDPGNWPIIASHLPHGQQYPNLQHLDERSNWSRHLHFGFWRRWFDHLLPWRSASHNGQGLLDVRRLYVMLFRR